jgi:hypothetical protein
MSSLAMKRVAHSFVLGGIDDAFFFTLEPGQPMKFNASLGMACDKSGDYGQFACQGIGTSSMCGPARRWNGGRRGGRRMFWICRGRIEGVLTRMASLFL